MPHNSDAERSILGNVILDNDLIYQAMELTVAGDYYVPSHRYIFQAMAAVFEEGLEITPVTIGAELTKQGKLESVGGLTFITGLTRGLAHDSIENLCTSVKELAMLRQLVKTSNNITQAALAQEEPAKVVLQNASTAIFNIVLQETKPGFHRIGQLAQKAVQRAHEVQDSGSAITGLSTGFIDLDAKTLGLQNSDLILIAGRPSMGKTAFALALAANAAIRDGKVVLFYSLEMPKESLANRIVCAEARVDSLRFRNGYLTPEEWDRIHHARDVLSHVSLFIDDTPGVTPLYVKTRTKRFIIEEGVEPDLIELDYLQLMGNPEGRERRSESRQQDVAQNSKDLKNFAREINRPLAALSQLSRAPESRTDHRPQLSDLRESGALEQDADLVMMMFREDKYKKASDHQATLTNICELILEKNRNGPAGALAGTINLRFDEPSGRFDNYMAEPA